MWMRNCTQTALTFQLRSRVLTRPHVSPCVLWLCSRSREGQAGRGVGTEVPPGRTLPSASSPSKGLQEAPEKLGPCPRVQSQCPHAAAHNKAGMGTIQRGCGRYSNGKCFLSVLLVSVHPALCCACGG